LPQGKSPADAKVFETCAQYLVSAGHASRGIALNSIPRNAGLVRHPTPKFH
jgi:hypothetical protein